MSDEGFNVQEYEFSTDWQLNIHIDGRTYDPMSYAIDTVNAELKVKLASGPIRAYKLCRASVAHFNVMKQQYDLLTRTAIMGNNRPTAVINRNSGNIDYLTVEHVNQMIPPPSSLKKYSEIQKKNKALLNEARSCLQLDPVESVNPAQIIETIHATVKLLVQDNHTLRERLHRERQMRLEAERG